MAAELLTTAVQLIKSGDKQAALPILKEIVQADPNNENAWLWLYSCVEKPEQKKYCLGQALKINPDNQNARKALDKLNEQMAPLPSSRPEPAGLETAQPEPDQPEPDQPEPDQPEPDQPEPDQPEPDQPEPDKSEPVQPEPAQVATPSVDDTTLVSPAPQTTQKPVRKYSVIRSLLLLLGIVVILVLCFVGAVFGWTYVNNSYLNKSSLTLPSTNQNIPKINPTSLAQVGVFVVGGDGSLTRMEKNRGGPSPSGMPKIANSAPDFLLNDPEIDPSNLIFGQYTKNGIEKWTLNLSKDGSAYLAAMSELSDGIYCFAQYGAQVAPGQADMWCVQIGNP